MGVRTCAVALGLALVAPLAHAAPSEFPEGVEALRAGHVDEAIARFEHLANAGVVDAAVSFDRGLAYATRLTQAEPKAGDFGQAIAAFEEATALATGTPLRDRADRAADAVRGELARKRHREGARAAYEPAPSLGERSIALLPEWLWFTFACLFALSATAGAFVRRAPLVRWGLRLSFVLVLPCLFAAWFVRDQARYGRAVVVVESARLLDDESHRPLAETEPLVEGALLTVEPAGGTEVRVHAAGIRGLLPRTSVRVLAR